MFQRKENHIMTKTITTIALLVSFLSFEARASQLFLRTQSFIARADISGQTYFSQNGNFDVAYLNAGYHFVSIFDVNRHPNNHRDNRRGRHASQYVVFTGRIFIPESSQVFAQITPRGSLLIERIVPMRRERYAPPPPRQGRGGDGRRDYNNGATRYQDPIVFNQRNLGFEALLGQLDRTTFDSDRKIIAKQYLLANRVTSNEVLQLLQNFRFESDRLDVAKIAYNSTLDPENYFLVNDAFQYSSSINALDRFIRS